MIETQEPRNGDFVEYVDRLQKDSEARLRAQAELLPHDAATRSPIAVAPPAAIGSPGERLVGIRRFLRSLTPTARFVLAGAVLGIGAFQSMRSSSFEGLVATLFLGAGLLVWALPRSDEATKEHSAKDTTRLHESIEKLFGSRAR